MSRYALAAATATTTANITKRPLTVTADDRSKTYGEALVLGNTAFSVAGTFVGGDNTLRNCAEHHVLRMMSDLQLQFGQIDIYLFDQLLRGRIPSGARILDAGCGDGRNLVYLLRAGYDVFAVDSDRACIQSVQRMAAQLAPALPADSFRVEPVEAMSFPDGFADVVLSSAVLHFARDEAHFAGMLRGMWRVLRPGGLLFCRLASSIGMEHRVVRIAGRRYQLPDGSQRYLVDEAMLLSLTTDLGGQLVDPLKTTVVQDQRCMTTWVVRKGA